VKPRSVEKLRALPAENFRRLLGVQPETFAAMLAAYEVWAQSRKKPGRPPALSLAGQLALAPAFWRTYRGSFSHRKISRLLVRFMPI